MTLELALQQAAILARRYSSYTFVEPRGDGYVPITEAEREETLFRFHAIAVFGPDGYRLR